jgi:hypothetical protein
MIDLTIDGLMKTADDLGLTIRRGSYLNESRSCACAAGIASIKLVGWEKFKEKRQDIGDNGPAKALVEELGENALKVRAIELGFEGFSFSHDPLPEEVRPFYEVGQQLYERIS